MHTVPRLKKSVSFNLKNGLKIEKFAYFVNKDYFRTDSGRLRYYTIDTKTYIFELENKKFFSVYISP